MKIFSPRETPTQNLTFIAIMAGFDAILCLVGTLLPFSALLLMVLIPLISSGVALFCKGRYMLVYVLGAIGVSFAICAWNITTALFYLIPGLISGVIYGYMWRLKTPSPINIFVNSLINLGLFYLSFLLIRALFDGVDMVSFLLSVIGRNDEAGRTIFPLFAFFYGLAQTLLAHLFILFQLRRMGIGEIEGVKWNWLYPCIGLLFLGLSMGLAFLYLPFAYLFLGFGLFWSINSHMLLHPRISPLTIAALVISIVIAIIVFPLLLPHFPEKGGLLILAIPLAISDIAVLINPFFVKILPFKPHRD